jgi:hypothetical protein
VGLPVRDAGDLARRLSAATFRANGEGDRDGPSMVLEQAVAWDPSRWPQGTASDLTVTEFVSDFDMLLQVITHTRRNPQTLEVGPSPLVRSDHEHALFVLLSSPAEDPVVRALADLRRASRLSLRGWVTARRWRAEMNRRAPMLREEWNDLRAVVVDDPRFAL